MYRKVLLLIFFKFIHCLDVSQENFIRDDKVLEIELNDDENIYRNSTPFSNSFNNNKNEINSHQNYKINENNQQIMSDMKESYSKYKTTYGLKFDPSNLGNRVGGTGSGAGTGSGFNEMNNKNNEGNFLQKEITTIDPKLDFTLQMVKKSGKKKVMKNKKNNQTSALKGTKKRTKNMYIRNPLTVVTKTVDKPLNDTLRVKKLEKYHKVLGTLKKSVKRLKRLTRDNSTKVVPDQVSARWLNVLDIVEYETKPFCSSAPRPLAGLIGQCYSERQCAQLGGVAFDYCVYGYGVCCIFKMSCNGFTDQDVSYFDSPGYPAPSLAELSCSMAIVLKPNTQQLMLDFEFFELLPPTEGDCVTDRFVISGQNFNKPLPILCGVNTGQHMYIDVYDAIDRKIFLTVVGTGNEPRAFRIKVTQLIERRAPPDCLQFHEGTTGLIKSFNYDDHSKVVRRRFPSYLNNLNYAICVRRISGFCTVSYSTEEIQGSARNFQLLNTDMNGLRTLPAGQAGAEIFNCPDDYIAVNAIRLCGERLNDATITADFTKNEKITDFSFGPIIIPVRTNEHTVGRGFSLKYTQQPCLSYAKYMKK